MEIYRILADLVKWFTLMWAGVLIGGFVLSVMFKEYYKKLKYFRLCYEVALISTFFWFIIFLGSPFIALENALRMQYDPKLNFSSVSLTIHFLEKCFGLQVSPGYIALMTIAVLAISYVLVSLARGVQSSRTHS